MSGDIQCVFGIIIMFLGVASFITSPQSLLAACMYGGGLIVLGMGLGDSK
jgi:hypothetical protein